jgi:hypothetical protein
MAGGAELFGAGDMVELNQKQYKTDTSQSAKHKGNQHMPGDEEGQLELNHD